ncbi:MAG TPA: hypothetical protein VKV38_02060 [Trebonia sp.]|jgi:hypothetical protein|nr:hypothetical protein [Trebonia sp.]
MYCWALLAGDISDVPYLMGVTGDLAGAMRVCEQHLVSGKPFLGYIEAVRPSISAPDLDSRYVRIGLMWVGRRTVRGEVRWEEHEGYFGEDLPAALPQA